jgi:hypothetical protein
MRSRSVEITQVDVTYSVGDFEILERHLEDELRPPIGAERTLGMLFNKRDGFRFTVGCATRGKNDGPYTVPCHGGEKLYTTAHIGPIVFSRIADRFSHIGSAGEMKDHVKGLTAEELIECRADLCGIV